MAGKNYGQHSGFCGGEYIVVKSKCPSCEYFSDAGSSNPKYRCSCSKTPNAANSACKPNTSSADIVFSSCDQYKKSSGSESSYSGSSSSAGGKGIAKAVLDATGISDEFAKTGEQFKEAVADALAPAGEVFAEAGNAVKEETAEAFNEAGQSLKNAFSQGMDFMNQSNVDGFKLENPFKKPGNPLKGLFGKKK